jgi:hypothetical protein
MQESVLNNDEVFCNVPLHILALKLTLKCVKNISILHDMFMPSKILLKNAQILLQDHKCQCGVFLLVFKPYKEEICCYVPDALCTAHYVQVLLF